MATPSPPYDPMWNYPLTRDQIKALDDELYDALVKDGCDGTMRHTKAFLKERDVASRKVMAWLRRSGGYCDCEVYLNVARPMATW